MIARLGHRLAREPVMAIAAVLGTIEAAWPGASPATKIAIGLWAAYLQRCFTNAKATTEERVQQVAESARNAALADVASLKPARPARKAAAKKGA